MNAEYEVVISGAGHNALCVAAYLAKAGVKVCVVEKNEYVGGGVLTREVAAPGFKTDICSFIHVMIQGNPLILNDELELRSKFGLEYIYPDIQMCVHFHDGTYLNICKPLDMMIDSIARYSKKDAKAYKAFYDWSIQSLDLLLAGMYSPTPSFGSFVAMMDQSEEGRGLLRAMMVSALDIIDDWFENEKVKIALTRWVSECMIAPQTKGTGFVFFIMVPMVHKFGGGMPVGGSGVLSESLERCILHHGGDIKLSSTVKEFKLENNECKGVILDSGEEILGSKAVVSTLNMKQMFPDMVKDAALPEGFVTSVERLRPSDFVCFQQGFALNEAPKYKAGGEIDEAFLVEFAPSTLEGYLRYFDDMSYGIRTNHNPVVACLTLFDKTRAPEGKHTLYLYEYTPFELADGGSSKWDEIREEHAEDVLNFLREYTTNMGPENIIGQWIQSPLDLERHNSAFKEGDFMQIGAFLDQTMGNRPLPGWNYKTPVDKLFMCGPGTHPGGGVIGGGRAAVQAVMEELGIDFENVIS